MENLEFVVTLPEVTFWYPILYVTFKESVLPPYMYMQGRLLKKTSTFCTYVIISKDVGNIVYIIG